MDPNPSSRIKQQHGQQPAKDAEIRAFNSLLRNEIQKRKEQERINGMMLQQLSEAENEHQMQLQQAQQQAQQQLLEVQKQLKEVQAELQRMGAEHEGFVQQLGREVDESVKAMWAAKEAGGKLEEENKKLKEECNNLQYENQVLKHDLAATREAISWQGHFQPELQPAALQGNALPPPASIQQDLQHYVTMPSAWPTHAPAQDTVIASASTAAPAAEQALPACEPAVQSNLPAGIVIKKELTPSAEAGSWPAFHPLEARAVAAAADSGETGEVRNDNKYPGNKKRRSHSHSRSRSRTRTRSRSRSCKRSRSRSRKHHQSRGRSESNDSGSRKKRPSNKKSSESRRRAKGRSRSRSRSVDRRDKRGRSRSGELRQNSRSHSPGTLAPNAWLKGAAREYCRDSRSRDAAVHSPGLNKQMTSHSPQLPPPPLPPAPAYITDDKMYALAGSQHPGQLGVKPNGEAGHYPPPPYCTSWQRPAECWPAPNLAKSGPHSADNSCSDDSGPPAFAFEHGTEGAEVYNEINSKPIAQRKRKKPGKGGHHAGWGATGGKATGHR